MDQFVVNLTETPTAKRTLEDVEDLETEAGSTEDIDVDDEQDVGLDEQDVVDIIQTWMDENLKRYLVDNGIINEKKMYEGPTQNNYRSGKDIFLLKRK